MAYPSSTFLLYLSRSRAANGWKGADLIHDREAAVRMLAYYWEDATSTLRGAVYFSPRAESHRGQFVIGLFRVRTWTSSPHQRFNLHLIGGELTRNSVRGVFCSSVPGVAIQGSATVGP
jgi:hypothetical protein